MSEVVVCYSLCEPCQFGCHFDPPEWHSWAGPEDIDHAANTGQPDPSPSPCACGICGTPPTEQQRAADAEAIKAAVDAGGVS